MDQKAICDKLLHTGDVSLDISAKTSWIAAQSIAPLQVSVHGMKLCSSNIIPHQ